MMPKVTVLMPVYNGEGFIKKAIDSILNQTFTDYEFLIINDKSTDDTKNLILSYNDKRIRFLQNENNLGQMGTLNIGIRLSGGEYVARMDQDDISLPERLEKEVNLLDKKRDITLVYADSYIIDAGGRRRPKTLFDYSKPYRMLVFDKLLRRNFITGNTVMMRKKVLNNSSSYNANYRIAAEYDLYLRLTQQYAVDFIDEVLAEYRVHGENASRQTENTMKEIISIIKNLNTDTLDRSSKKILRRTLSWYVSNLGMEYLFQAKRDLCKDKAKEALMINRFNFKALSELIFAFSLPQNFIDITGSLRKKWLE